MHRLSCSPAPPHGLFCIPHHSPRFHLLNPSQSNLSIPSCRHGYGGEHNLLVFAPKAFKPIYRNYKRKKIGYTILKAIGRESPYDVLGVSPSATTNEIKRAYRKLALKYHPDVNKEADAQDKFLRIKHAYSTLLNSESRRKYDSGNRTSDFSYSTAQRSQSRNTQDDEEFYGFEDLFRDLQDEFRNWEASASSQGKPKSLWEELAEIGEEFVEFLEKELNITDPEVEGNDIDEESKKGNPFNNFEAGRTGSDNENEAGKGSSIEENIDEIEATLAQLKRELGL